MSLTPFSAPSLSEIDFITPTDRDFFRLALRLGRRGLGRTAPNPSVGCVLVKDGRVVGRGWTQPGGRPHAEVHALGQAGSFAQGATAYVTLEPCSHTGQTGPCTHALIESGVTRVVVGPKDPDPRVAGQGLEHLQSAGLSVVRMDGREETEANRDHAGFFLTKTQNRPLVTLKTATSLDGKIATCTGDSQWITSPESRTHSHKIRATYDGILIGINTALADDPSLTVRLSGMEHHAPIRIVLDSHLRLPTEHLLVQTAREVPTLLITQTSDKGAYHRYMEAGVDVMAVQPDLHGHVCLKSALAGLSQRGINRLMVEGGEKVAGSLIKQRFIDRIIWYRAPCVIGNDGIGNLGSLGISEIKDVIRLDQISLSNIEQDTLQEFDVRYD